MSNIFISYRRSDSQDVASRIYDRLAAHFSRDCVFKDVNSIPLSAPFPAYLQEALEKVKVVVVIIGLSWLTAIDSAGTRRLDDLEDSVRIEVETALRIGVPTIPVTVSHAPMPRATELPEPLKDLAYRNGQPVRPDPDFHRDMDRLIATLKRILGHSSAGEFRPNTAATVVNALHQLPAPPRDFTGREKELNELLDAHEQGGYLITCVQGLGGVGKTALALKLAEQLKPRFPDAQFYLDLRGASPQPMAVTEALAHVIRAYHPDAKLPNDVASLQALYRSTLDGQQAIVLMDNAANRTQVEPLIPPATCLLLVTSRQHFTLTGLFRQKLESMSPAEARELLLKIAPRIGEPANEIARLCGYLPLPLRIAASLLDENRDLSVAEYIRRLSDERRRLESLKREDQSVAASLGLSHELLSEELHGLWRSLAVFPATFELGGAAAIWELERDAAQDAISRLVRYSLVDWIEHTARYLLHDLARLFAGQQLGDTERDIVKQRHAAHYCLALADAEGLYVTGGEAIKRGLDLFDAEWGNIQAGQAWAVERGEANPDAARLCIEYPDAGVQVLYLRQRPRERIHWLETMLAASRRSKQRASEYRALGYLGVAYRSLGDYRRAIDFQEQSLAIAREIGDRSGEGAALDNLGVAYRYLGNYRRAIDFHKQRLAVAREIGNRESEGSALYNLSLNLNQIGQRAEAIAQAEAALKIAEEIESPYTDTVRQKLAEWRNQA